jgi:hypothetical protein
MNQDDQRFVLMAAAAQGHYAKQQARREVRKAALLSQVSALSNSSQPMDPKLQAELERLIRAENMGHLVEAQKAICEVAIVLDRDLLHRKNFVILSQSTNSTSWRISGFGCQMMSSKSCTNSGTLTLKE